MGLAIPRTRESDVSHDTQNTHTPFLSREWNPGVLTTTQAFLAGKTRILVDQLTAHVGEEISAAPR